MMELARHARRQPDRFAASGLPLTAIDEIMELVADPLVCAQLVGKSLAACERGVAFRLNPASYLPGLPHSAGDVVTVLGNLIDNAMDAALKAGRNRPFVEVSFDRHEDVLRFSVTDNGPGVAPFLRRRIFVNGFSDKASPAGPPRGVGLALVRAVVRKRKGSVTVADRRGGGAVFTVRMQH